jgi:hypothetical protein
MTLDQINQLLHAYVTDGACWHEFNEYPRHCSKCGEFIDSSTLPVPSPSYSAPDNFEVLTDKLFGDEKIWLDFYLWAGEQFGKEYFLPIEKWVKVEADLAAWLFLDWSRFCSLFASFLYLPETIDEFGYMECPHCEGTGWESPSFNCKDCNGSGKILKQWAILAKEIKDE